MAPKAPRTPQARPQARGRPTGPAKGQPKDQPKNKMAIEKNIKQAKKIPVAKKAAQGQPARPAGETFLHTSARQMIQMLAAVERKRLSDNIAAMAPAMKVGSLCSGSELQECLACITGVLF